MRTEEEILSLVMHVAETNAHIRAVLLTGSRANPGAVKDPLQDYDIIYVVTQLQPFIQDHRWVNIFGERLIMQLPEEMDIGARDKHAFHYLMLFTDGNRIDLTLFPLDKIHVLLQQESRLQLLLDKDDCFASLQPPGEEKYLLQPPTAIAFADCCNEFWWVSTYVAKGLWRKEIVYAKAMLEDPVRSVFLQMIAWYIGVHTNFTVSFGKNGRNIQRYLSPALYQRVLATYAGSNINNNWTALFAITTLFDELAREVAKQLHFIYNKEEAANVMGYLRQVFATQAD